MLVCSKGTYVIEILNNIFTKPGCIYLINKRKTCRGKHPFLWSQISNYTMIALANQPYQPWIPTLRSPYSNIPL